MRSNARCHLPSPSPSHGAPHLTSPLYKTVPPSQKQHCRRTWHRICPLHPSSCPRIHPAPLTARSPLSSVSALRASTEHPPNDCRSISDNVSLPNPGCDHGHSLPLGQRPPSCIPRSISSCLLAHPQPSLQSPACMRPPSYTSFYPPFEGPSKAPPSPLTATHSLSLAPHPNNLAPPKPPRLPLPTLPDGWTRSFHAVPAAYPRQLREAHGTLTRESHPFRQGPVGSETKTERRARVNEEALAATRIRFQAEEWSAADALAEAPKGLFIAVERWRRDRPRGGKTLVCTHPNSTQKEVGLVAFSQWQSVSH